MPNALVAFWRVRAGVIPGHEEPAYSRDVTLALGELGRLSGDEMADLFARRRDEAVEYARAIMDPKKINWVTLEFVWV